MATAPHFMEQIAAGAVHVPTAYPLPRVDEAWADDGDGRAVVVPNISRAPDLGCRVEVV